MVMWAGVWEIRTPANQGGGGAPLPKVQAVVNATGKVIETIHQKPSDVTMLGLWSHSRGEHLPIAQTAVGIPPSLIYVVNTNNVVNFL